MTGRSRKPGPPRLARVLLSLGVHAEDRAAARADLDDGFRRVLRERGRPAARRWYWWQVIRGILYRVIPDPDVLWRRSWTGLAGDVRHRARALVRRPAYTLGVVGTLAVGLSAAVTVGTLAWRVWLSPMPFPDPEGVVRLFEIEPAREDAGPIRRRVSPPLLERMREREWVTVGAVAGVGRNVLEWRRDGETRRITALAVSPEIFDILGIRPGEGRTLSHDADAREVVLTEAFRRDAFGQGADVVGRATMNLAGEDHQVVGVVRLTEGYPRDAEVLVPLRWAGEQLVPGMRGARYLDVVGRVRAGFDVAEASEEMARVVADAGREEGQYVDWRGGAVVLGDDLLEPYGGIFAMLLAAGAVFLLLAVVNVAGLVSARAHDVGRQRAIRTALGASQGRLLRAALVESALLAVAAGALALGAVQWILGPIRGLAPVEVPRMETVGMGVGTVAGVVGVTVVVAVAVGLLGHLINVRSSALTREWMPRTGRSPSRSGIVAAQVGFTTVLMCAGGTILGTVVELQNVDLGFHPEGVSSALVSLTGERYPDAESRLVKWRVLLEELGGRGADAAIGTNPPMAGVNMPWGYRVDPTAEQAFAQYHIVSAGYFDVMGIEVVEGRVFSGEDREDSPPVVVVNDALARAEFGPGPAVGRRIEVVSDEKTIVGVVRGVRHTGPDAPVPTEIYAPFTQDPWPHAQLLIEAPPELASDVTASALAAVDAGLELPPLQPYGRFVQEWYAGLTLQLLVVGVLGGVGLVMAALGLYALMAYRVSARRSEIGVRMALGASRGKVFTSVLRHGMTITVAGLVVGLLVWTIAGPVVESRWGGIDFGGVSVPLGVVLFIVTVAAPAVAVPARRSTVVDPAVALRRD